MFNLQQVAGDFQRLLGKTQQVWGRLIHKPFDVIQGRRRELIGKFKAMQALTAARTY